MRRRDFISAFSQLSLVAGTASVAQQAYSKSRNIADDTLDQAGARITSLAKRLDSIEDKQQKMMKALILTTAVSTGIDLSLVL